MPTRRTRTAAVGTVALAGAPPADPIGELIDAASDPIFAAMDAHRVAWEAMDASPIEADDIEDLVDDSIRAFEHLIRMRPATAAGALAFLQYLGKHQAAREFSDYSCEDVAIWDVFGAIADALAA